MDRRPLHRFSLIACLGVLVACATAPTRVVDARANGQRIALKVGQEIDILLDEKPATGYNWDRVQGATKVLTPLGTPQFEPLLDPFRILGSGITTHRFRAIAAGDGTLEFVFRRPAELIAPGMPKLAFKIVVE